MRRLVLPNVSALLMERKQVADLRQMHCYFCSEIYPSMSLPLPGSETASPAPRMQCAIPAKQQGTVNFLARLLPKAGCCQTPRREPFQPQTLPKVIQSAFVPGAFHTTSTDTRGRDGQRCVLHGLSKSTWKPTELRSGIVPLPHPAPERCHWKSLPQSPSKTPLSFLCSANFQKVNFIRFPGWHNNLLAAYKHGVDPLYKPRSGLETTM